MNPQIEKLYLIGKKPARLILGMMSGTSVDGLDIALCEITGYGKETKVHFIDGETMPFDDVYRARMNRAISNQSGDWKELTVLHSITGRIHAELVMEFLGKRKIPSVNIDLLASHGQTLFHAPRFEENNKGRKNATLQIGDGDHIAWHTGIITISDFRQKHTAAGGEGAPLAPYGDLLIFGEKDRDVCLLNIGGIANISFIPAGSNASGLICGDTGPGNTLMDAWIKKHNPEQNFDKNGEMAARGNPDSAFVNLLKSDPFFQLPFPKSTGREIFNSDYIEDAISLSGKSSLPPEDIMAGLNLLTAETISDAIKSLIDKNRKLKLYISGGGKHNKELIKNIMNALSGYSVDYSDTGEKGIPSDMKEAVIFALLANECIAGDPLVFSGHEKSLPAVSMGKISLPG